MINASCKLMKLSTVSFFIISLSGCASQIMQGYVGKSVQSVMLDYGSPENAFDMPDNTRVFQWVKRGSYTTPINVNTTSSGSASSYGNVSSGWVTSRSTVTGGQTITSKCVYSLYTKWDEQKQAYIVTGFKKPSFICE